MQTEKSATNNLEVELKFELTRKDVNVLTKDPAFIALQISPPRQSSLRATYFDTCDQKLSQRDVSLRVRKESRLYVQCCKVKAPHASADRLAREEWQWRVPGPDLDVQLLKTDKRMINFFKGVDLDKLQVQFTTNIKRQSRLLETPGGAHIRCDIDRGHIQSRTQELLVFELELELERGSERELLDLARLVTSIVPARLSSRTKAKRGLLLALNERGMAGLQQDWAKACPVTMPDNATAHEVLSISLIDGLKHLIANEDCVLTRHHIEGVHQMRVALRRMRAVITTYKKVLPTGCFEDLSRNLKAAGRTLGPARDWDVFTDGVLADVQSHFNGDPAFDILYAKVQQHRDVAYIGACDLIYSAAYAQVLTQTLHWVGTEPWIQEDLINPLAIPATKMAHNLLQHRHKKLIELGKGLAELSMDQRHQLRIAIKKMRYGAEIFAPLYPKKRVKDYIKCLCALQNGLGHMNDLVMAKALMADLISDGEDEDSPALHRAIGRVEGWCSCAQEMQESNLLNTWTAFTKAKPFW